MSDKNPSPSSGPRGEARSRPLGIETRAIHGGSSINRTAALTPPIFQSSTFKLASARQGAEFATSDAPTEFYTRWGNPTTRQFEVIIAGLEGAEAALATGSGMGAIATLFHAVLSAGDHVVVGTSIYSGTSELARDLAARRGIGVTSVDGGDLAAIEAAIGERTRLLHFETPTNPTLDIADLAGIAAIGKRRGIVTSFDNTFATPVLQRPLERGIDVVVHSATKYIGGHSDVTAGVIAGGADLVRRAWRVLKLHGAALSPFEAWLLIRGLKTLPLRVERQSATALELARRLAAHAAVERVHYPGLESHPGHALAARQMSAFGGMLSFEVRGGLEPARRVAESLRIIQLAVSLGGVESIVQHPASMSHVMLSEDALRAAGIVPGLLRLSIGLETAADLAQDLEQALAKV